MRRSWIVFALFLVSLVATEAHALRLGDQRVIIPVIGRFPGAGGSQWQTDVFLANPFSPTVNVTLNFYPTGEPVVNRLIVMEPFSVVTLTDVCLTVFGRANTGGTLEVVASGGFVTEARARIYNVGNPAGQFGQTVPGIGINFLRRQSHLYGLSTSSEYRLNVGVNNPNDAPVDVTMFISSATNEGLYSRTVTVPAHSFVQFNDIASTFGIPPQDGLSIEINTVEESIYGYASEVRNDTGDASFVFGLSPNV